MPTPLPPNPFPPGPFYAAYQRCLVLEAMANLRAPPHCPPPIICARILGHLLCLASANGQRQIQQEITSAADSVELMELAGVYMRHFVCTFKHRRGPTPPPSTPQPSPSPPSEPSSPPPPSFEDFGQYPITMMQDRGIEYYNSRATARRRDNNRCMLSGKGGFAILQAAHIIPEAYDKRTEDDDDDDDDDDACEVGIYDYLLVPTQDTHSTGVLAFLSMFTDVIIAEELAGKLIHRLENIMTLHYDCHYYFADLCLWLKPVVGLPHTYQAHEALQGLKSALGIPDIVTFNTTTEFPLPDPALLALHALCCEVAWMSGAVEYINEVKRMMDELRRQEDCAEPADLLIKAVALVEACFVVY